MAPRKRRPDRKARREAVEEIVRGLHRIFQAVDVFSKYAHPRFGLTGPQIRAPRTIVRSKEATVGDLAGRMYLHVSTVSGVLDRLEERGLVGRFRRDDDRRVVRLRLTPRGRSVLRQAPEPPRSKVPRNLGRRPRPELERLRWAVEELIRAMEV